MGEITTRVVDFGLDTVKAATVLDNNGDFSIYLNARLTIEAQRRALQHELRHITCDDFCNDLPMSEIENFVVSFWHMTKKNKKAMLLIGMIAIILFTIPVNA